MNATLTAIPTPVVRVITAGFYGMQSLGVCLDECCIDTTLNGGQYGTSYVYGETGPAYLIVFHNGEWSFEVRDND